MKRLVTSIVVLILTAVFCCLYYFGALAGLESLNQGLNNFGNSICTSFSLIGETLKLQPKDAIVVFIALCYLVFLLVFLIITGIVVHKTKNKIAKNDKASIEQENSDFNPESGYPYFIPLNIPATSSYQSVNTVLSQEEKKEEFRWENFVGGRSIVRKVVIALIIVVAVLFLVLRFFWTMRDDQGSTGLSFLNGIVNSGFTEAVMKPFDSILGGIFGQFAYDAANPEQYRIAADVFNGQGLYVDQVLDFVAIIIATYLLITIYYLLTYGLCYLFRKWPATRRAKTALADYEEDVKNNIVPTYRRRTVRGTSYIFNYFINSGGQAVSAPAFNYPTASPISEEEPSNDVAPITNEEPIGEYDHIDTSNEYNETPKAELVMGGANFTGASILAIAECEPLDEQFNAEESSKKIDFVEDIGEGVKEIEAVAEIDEEKPFEEYEDKVGEKEDARVAAIADVVPNLESITVDDLTPVDEARLGSIFEIENEIEENSADDEQEEEIVKVIDFDEDGFAYQKIVKNSEEEYESIPEVINLDLARDSSPLVEGGSATASISEPDFEVLASTSLVAPVICTQSSQSNDYNLQSLGDDNIYETISSDENTPTAEPIRFTAEQKELLDEYTASGTPVDRLPDVGECIPDNGAIKLDEEVRPDFAAEIAEIPSSGEAKPVPTALPNGLKPIHEIKARETPKIVPLTVQKEESVPEEIAPAAPVLLKGPLHEINTASRKKDIQPVSINKDYRFALKRFQTSTYKGNLTAEEAFNLGVTKVTPIVNPVTDSAARDSSIPSWMKRVKERNAKQLGVSESQLKQAEELSSIWDVNSKKDTVRKVNEVSLRRRRKVEVPVAFPASEEKDEINISRPSAPIAVDIKKEEIAVKPVETTPKLIKPLSPAHKPDGEAKAVQPIKPIHPIKPRK